MEVPKNGLVLLPKATLLYWNYLLTSVAADGKDGNGLKLANFFKFLICVFKQRPKICFGLLFQLKFVRYLLRSFAWAFCVSIKLSSNDFSSFDLKQQNPHDSASLRVHEMQLKGQSPNVCESKNFLRFCSNFKQI